MKSTISVPVSTKSFLELAKFLESLGSDRDPVSAVEDAIYYFMENANWKQEDLLPETVRSGASDYSDSRGYSWKYKDSRVFLPHGTELRMRYGKRYHYAKVEQDEILYEGQPVSPAGFANAIAGGSRNAWKDLWLKRPGSTEWELADTYRREGEAFIKEINAMLQEPDE